jgi:type I restriction enzyme R subunit
MLGTGGFLAKNGTYMKPEERARQIIDHLLEAAGWAVQDYHQLNLGASLGVAIREFPLESGSADYLLFVDKKAADAIDQTL